MPEIAIKLKIDFFILNLHALGFTASHLILCYYDFSEFSDDDEKLTSHPCSTTKCTSFLINTDPVSSRHRVIQYTVTDVCVPVACVCVCKCKACFLTQVVGADQ